MKKKILKLISLTMMSFTVLVSNVWAAEGDKAVVLQNSAAFTAPTDFKPVCYVFEGESFTIAETLDEYYGVLLENNELVYIEKEYIKVEDQVIPTLSVEVPEVKLTAAPVVKEEKVISKGEQVVEYAKQFIGVPYVSGGNSLKTGVDCSGFTSQVYLNFGVQLDRRSGDQYLNNGVKVAKKEDLQPGDLVFYGYGSKITHVAIYMGDSQIIHSPVPGKTVSIAPLWQRGDANIIGYKRIV